jgi:hypothetical protein
MGAVEKRDGGVMFFLCLKLQQKLVFNILSNN